MKRLVKRVFNNMTVRLSWWLVLGAFLALILLLGALGLTLLAQASAALAELAPLAGDAGTEALERFAARADDYRWAVIGVVGLSLLTAIVVVWGVSLNVLRPLGQVVDHCDRMAQGDLTVSVEQHGNNEIGRLYAALASLQANLERTVGTVRHGSDAIHQGSRHIASGNQDLSSRTEEQAAALQQTAASMEQLASTVKQNADNARHASRLAEDASRTAAEGGQVVNGVVATMHEISESSHRVSDIIKVIDSIAFQTNILALNASVEAARAGEQGRGFAVVAGEVRNLAGRSAEASRQIRELIEISVSTVDAGTERADRAGRAMGEIVAAVQKVSDIMDEIASASAEQSHGIDQVNLAVTQMDQVTQQNAELVQQAGSVASQVATQAERLSRAVAGFRLEGSTPVPTPDREMEPALGANEVHDAQLARWMPALMPSSPAKRARDRGRGTDRDQEWESF
ncbi:methyl-accepting chemotaxis protein [Halomonas sp.]|uniref:methyl-accepting chemotaxis protein n=1 Tax=Halomonas sp. TaxID=1486246 RepID=UPI0025C28B00|nr:methyl-accepting chemotaxis protein [Halomonas sp.]